jgi:hypothetical protein
MIKAMRVLSSVVVVGLLMMTPSPATAQNGSGIAGVVKDGTGAVMPGVTVEAASPALIEKLRTAFTDAQGQYKIIGLRPGAYTVTFSLPGFTTARVEDVQLPPEFTATVNAELRVASLAETVTVSGQAPTVDIQNAQQTRVLAREVLDDIPTSRSMNQVVALVPGATLPLANQDVGGSSAEGLGDSVTIHGSRSIDMGVEVDGMRFNGVTQSGGGGAGLRINMGTTQEIVVETAGVSAEHELGGLRMNVIPKEGGNRFTGYFAGSFSNHSLQSNNVTDALQARGISVVNSIDKVWDVNPAFGGPLKNDQLWFYAGVRAWGSDQNIAGSYVAKDPLAWTFTPDLTHPAIRPIHIKDENVRLTWQAAAKHKFNFYLDETQYCNCAYGLSPTQTLASSLYFTYSPDYVAQVSWKAPLTNRLLVEAGATKVLVDYNFHPQPGIANDTIGALELSTNTQFRGLIGGWLPRNRNANLNATFSVSYITGSHAFKAGTTLAHGDRNQVYVQNDQGLSYTLLNGSPVSLTEWSRPTNRFENLGLNLGPFVQDQWTIRRLTLNLGVRLDYLSAYVPAQSTPATLFLPPQTYDEIDNLPNWKDVNPRIGIAYDLFGNGKTAVKAELGRYVVGQSLDVAQGANPISAIVTTATRTWTDRNGDFVPQCDLLNTAANGECGPLSNNGFGTLRILTHYDPSYIEGWQKRNGDWEGMIGLQQELRPGLSLNASYHRRSYFNFACGFVYLSANIGPPCPAYNQLTTPSNYDPYCITAPSDPRLPGGGGNPICGLFDINPSKFGQVNNLVTAASRFGNVTEVFNGVDVTVNGQLPGGAFVTGGLSTGRTATNSCAVVNSPQELRFCDVTPPFWQPSVKVLGTYPLPWWGIRASGALQSVQGPMITATFIATNSQIAPSLGRNLAAGANGTAPVELIQPGTMYEARVNQLDFRIAKGFRRGNRHIEVMIDMFNALNSASILAVNTQFGPAWLQPTSVLGGRLLKFGVQADF